MAVKLEARGIRLDYLRPRTTIRQAALQDVDLQVMEGEFVCGTTHSLSDTWVRISLHLHIAYPASWRSRQIRSAAILPDSSTSGNPPPG